MGLGYSDGGKMPVKPCESDGNAGGAVEKGRPG